MEQPMEEQSNIEITDGRKVHAENMRLKKRIYTLEQEIEDLKRFIGGM